MIEGVRVVVVDKRDASGRISEHLTRVGYSVDTVETASDAIDRGKRRDFDLMLLELVLADRDGLDVLTELRASCVDVPILVVTTRHGLDSRVAALDRGADDYLVKPVELAELVARIGAHIRRARGPRWRQARDLSMVIRDDSVVEFEGRIAKLSPNEHALLNYLARRCGDVVTRSELLQVFGYSFDPNTNLVDVHVMHLRTKLTGFPVSIETVRGTGFRLMMT